MLLFPLGYAFTKPLESLLIDENCPAKLTCHYTFIRKGYNTLVGKSLRNGNDNYMYIMKYNSLWKRKQNEFISSFNLN